MRSRLRRLRIVAVLLALGLGTGGATALAAGTYRDPPGDVSGGAGPDLTSIAVSHTSSTVTFRLRFAKTPPLGASGHGKWVDMLIVGLDTPPRSLKRSALGWRGADYYVGAHAKDTAATLVRSPQTPAGRGKVLAHPKISVSGHTLAFTVSRRMLGDPAWLEFAVAAGRESSRSTSGGSDEAPAHGAFHYLLRK